MLCRFVLLVMLRYTPAYFPVTRARPSFFSCSFTVSGCSCVPIIHNSAPPPPLHTHSFPRHSSPPPSSNLTPQPPPPPTRPRFLQRDTSQRPSANSSQGSSFNSTVFQGFFARSAAKDKRPRDKRREGKSVVGGAVGGGGGGR